MKSHYQICKKNLIKKDDSNLINEKLIEKKKRDIFQLHNSKQRNIQLTS